MESTESDFLLPRVQNWSSIYSFDWDLHNTKEHNAFESVPVFERAETSTLRARAMLTELSFTSEWWSSLGSLAGSHRPSNVSRLSGLSSSQIISCSGPVWQTVVCLFCSAVSLFLTSVYIQLLYWSMMGTCWEVFCSCPLPDRPWLENPWLVGYQVGRVWPSSLHQGYFHFWPLIWALRGLGESYSSSNSRFPLRISCVSVIACFPCSLGLCLRRPCPPGASCCLLLRSPVQLWWCVGVDTSYVHFHVNFSTNWVDFLDILRGKFVL